MRKSHIKTLDKWIITLYNRSIFYIGRVKNGKAYDEIVFHTFDFEGSFRMQSYRTSGGRSENCVHFSICDIPRRDWTFKCSSTMCLIDFYQFSYCTNCHIG